MLWQWTAQLEHGVNLDDGSPWRGHRIRYREQGTRRWHSFLLTMEPDQTPTESQVLTAIEHHHAQTTPTRRETT